MLIALSLAHAATLTVDVDDPPVRVREIPSLGEGAVRVRFGEHELDAVGSAVISLRLGAMVPPELRDEGRALGERERSWLVPAAHGEDALDVALRWADHPDVKTAMPNVLRERQPMAFDDPELGAQWYLDVLDFETLSAETLGDPAVRVAVIDGPIDHNHPDLAAGVFAPADVYEEDDDPSPAPGEGCAPGDTTSLCDNHGTSSAGIIAARSNNGVDLVGLCSECTLVPIRLLAGNNTTLAHDVAAFEHAIDNDVAVINNSWGFTNSIPAPGPLVEVIARTATESRGGLGSLVIFAAGNDDRRLSNNELTGLPEVLTVSATDRYGFATNYTNTGATVDIAAPSATVSLAAGGGLNTTFGGTSAAAPVVSGIAAWGFSVDPTLSAAEMADLLIATADPASEDGQHDETFGYGHLDPLALHDALLGIEPDPVPGDDPEDPRRACGCSSPVSAPMGMSGLFGGLVLFARRRS